MSDDDQRRCLVCGLMVERDNWNKHYKRDHPTYPLVPFGAKPTV